MRAPWRIIRLLDQGDRAGCRPQFRARELAVRMYHFIENPVEVKLNMGFFWAESFVQLWISYSDIVL